MQHGKYVSAFLPSLFFAWEVDTLSLAFSNCFHFGLFPCLLSSVSSLRHSSLPVHPMWQGPLVVPGGDRQSPIDIAVRKSVFDSELKPLVTKYDPQTCQQIWNNGYSFLVEYDDTTDKSSTYFFLHYFKMSLNPLGFALICPKVLNCVLH